MILGTNLMTENGYVVYSKDWPGTEHKNEFWNYIRKFKEVQVRNLLNELPQQNNNYYYQIGSNLKQLGQREREKELALIKEKLNITLNADDEYELIHKFNEILQGLDNYEQALKQLKLAINNYDNKQKQMAPVISSLFLSNLQHNLGIAINNFINTHKTELLNYQLEDWESNWEEVLNKAIDKSFKDLFKYENKKKVEDIFGSEKQHLQLFQEYMIESQKSDIFLKTIKESIGAHGIENMKNLIKDRLNIIQTKIINGKRMTGWSWSKSVVGASKSRAGQMGGSVQELIIQLLQTTSSNLQNGNNYNSILESNMAKTDNILISTTDVTVDVEKIVNDIQEDLLQNSHDLIDAEKIMSEHYEKYLKNLKKGFIVYTSSKAYAFDSINKSGGFGNDKNRPLNQLPEILSQGPMAMSKDKIENFLTIIINTRGGAAFQDSRDRVEVYAQESLFQAMAYLLFDDWIAIGKDAGDGKAIHTFMLDGIQIPLSVLLIGAGTAIQEVSGYKNWFSSSFTYPEKLEYNSWKEYPTKINGKGKEVADVEEAWEQQRQKALDGFYFSTHFMKNFKDYVVKLIKKY